MGESKRRSAALSQPAAKVTPPPPSNRAASLFQLGQDAHRQGRFIDAINHYQAALKLAPDQAEATHFQGLALLKIGQQALGLHWLKRAVQLAPDDGLYQFRLGNALSDVDPEAAVVAMRAAARLLPDDRELAMVFSDLLERQNLLAESARELERAHALKALDWQNLHKLAMRYYRCDALEQAKASYAAALALHPELANSSRLDYARPHPDMPAPAAPPGSAEFHVAASDNPTDIPAFVTATGLHIVDDFIDDPAAYRQHALGLPYHQQQHGGQNYPGVQTDGQPCQQTMERIATILGRTIKYVSPDNGAYRVSMRDNVARTEIHVDNESGDAVDIYAGVLYLNTADQCQGGTTFWRHAPTNWSCRPGEAEVRRCGYPSFRHFQQRALTYADGKPFNALSDERQDWQAILEVPMRHNRLILYRGHFFHSISKVFGDDMLHGRMAQLFFFELANA